MSQEVINPYRTMNSFKQAMQEAEDRKLRNRHDNSNASNKLINQI